MLLPIVSYPAPSLREKSEPVGEINAEIKKLASDMLETMYAAPGVGLAAPQVGRNIRMIVLDPAPASEPRKPMVLINPELELLGESIVSEAEGCLSVPLNYRASVKRKERVRLKALNLQGEQIDCEMDGFAAIILQHECDHLDGLLFIDHLSRLKRSLYDGKLRKQLKRQADEERKAASGT